MALRSLRAGFQDQTRLARRRRAVRHAYREAGRHQRLRDRERWLARLRLAQRVRRADRRRRLHSAHQGRVRKHKAMLARRQARMRGYGVA